MVDYIKEKIGGFIPKVAMVLGSGLGFLGDVVEHPTAIPYGVPVAFFADLG